MSTGSNLNESIRSLARSGVTAECIAEELGISLESVDLVLAARRDTRKSNGVLERISERGDSAVDVIEQLMHDTEVHPVVRLKAATYIADIASGVRAPVKHVTQDAPVAGLELQKVFEAAFSAYGSAIKRAQETPQHGVLIDA